jgi:Ca2+-binding EF-hand superfamily protein
MKKIGISLCVLTLTFVFSLVAPAQDPDISKQMEKAAKQAYKDLLKETDKDKDGKISKAEFYAVWKDKKVAEEKYAAWDLNKDGYITETEYVKVVVDLGNKKKK